MRKIFFVTLFLLYFSSAYAAVELDADGNGGVDIGKGGTNSTTAASARTALGVPATSATLAGDCTVGPCLDGTSDGGNLIKLWAGTGAYWTALQGGAPAANRSWRLPILAPPSAGETNVMTMDEYGAMAFIDKPGTTGYVLSSTDAGVLSWIANGSGFLPSATEGQILQANSSGVYVSTSSFAGLINDAGTDTDDLKSASWIISALGGKQATLGSNAYHPYTSALAGISGNSKYWGTNSSGTVGVYDLPAGGTPDDTPDNSDTTNPPTANWAYDHAALATSDTVVGHVEAATTAETTTGTSTSLAVTPDGLSGSIYGQKEIGWSVINSDTVTAVADGKQAAVITAGMNGMNLIDLTCSVHDLNSAASGTTTVVLRRVRGTTAVDMTSTGVTIGYNEYTASDDTVDTANDDLATGDKLYIDINAVTSAVQKGLSCTATFQTP